RIRSTSCFCPTTTLPISASTASTNALSFSTAAASARTSAATTVGAAGLDAMAGASTTVVCALAGLTVSPPTGPDDVASEAAAGTGCERGTGSVSMDPSTITCFPALCIPVCIYDAPMSDTPDRTALGPIDFSTHVLSLASSAMVALGTRPSPSGETIAVDLQAAKYLIDVLGMLEIKTKGNLDE